MDHEQRMTTLEKDRKEIEDNLPVMATLEARQSKPLREQSEYLVSHETSSSSRKSATRTS